MRMTEIDDARASLLTCYSQQTTGQSTNLLTTALIAVTLVGLQLTNRNYVLFGVPVLVFFFSRTLFRPRLPG